MAVRRKNKLNFTCNVIEEVLLNCQNFYNISFKNFLYFFFESYDFSILVKKSKNLQEFICIIKGLKEVKHDFELELIITGLSVLGLKKKNIKIFFEKLCNVCSVLDEVESDLNLSFKDMKYVWDRAGSFSKFCLIIGNKIELINKKRLLKSISTLTINYLYEIIYISSIFFSIKANLNFFFHFYLNKMKNLNEFLLFYGFCDIRVVFKKYKCFINSNILLKLFYIWNFIELSLLKKKINILFKRSMTIDELIEDLFLGFGKTNNKKTINLNELIEYEGDMFIFQDVLRKNPTNVEADVKVNINLWKFSKKIYVFKSERIVNDFIDSIFFVEEKINDYIGKFYYDNFGFFLDIIFCCDEIDDEIDDEIIISYCSLNKILKNDEIDWLNKDIEYSLLNVYPENLSDAFIKEEIKKYKKMKNKVKVEKKLFNKGKLQDNSNSLFFSEFVDNVNFGDNFIEETKKYKKIIDVITEEVKKHKKIERIMKKKRNVKKIVDLFSLEELDNVNDLEKDEDDVFVNDLEKDEDDVFVNDLEKDEDDVFVNDLEKDEDDVFVND